MAGSGEFKNKLQKRLGREEYEKIGQRGKDDPTKGGGYSAAEVKAEFRNRGQGTSVNNGAGSMTDYFQGLADDGESFNKRAKEFLTKRGVTFNDVGDTTEPPEDTPSNEPVSTIEPIDPPTQIINDPPRGIAPLDPGPYTGSGNSQSLSVRNDNKIINNISGDNSFAYNAPDNSVTQVMGGDYGSRYARGLKDQYVLNLLNR